MGITVKRTGPPVKFDAARAAQIIAAFVPGAILKRTGQGIDANGQPFHPYTASYRETLAKMGEDSRVDLRLTGGLMNSVKVRAKSVTPDGVSVTVAPDTGTSRIPQSKLAKSTVKRRNQEIKAAARALDEDRLREALAVGKRRRARSQERGPPHNVLGYWLHHGTPTMRARPFMGLSPDQRAELYSLLAKARLWG